MTENTITSDDESDIGRAREFKRMKARLQELETLLASQLRFDVPTSTTAKRQPLDKCCHFHLHVIVYMDQARVECRACGAFLDPLDVLRQFANRERNFADTLKHLREERDRLGKEIVALKKQRNSLRSQVRKKGGVPVEPWHIEDQR